LDASNLNCSGRVNFTFSRRFEGPTAVTTSPTKLISMMHASDWLIIECHNEIAFSQAGTLGWAIRFHRNDGYARLDR